MAKLFLDSGDTNYLVHVNDNVSNVYGSSGTESIILDSGVTNVTIDANVEGVQFSDALSTYKFKQTGNRLEVYANDGTTLISKIGLQGDSDGTQLTFSGTTIAAKYAPTVSSLNLTIGNQVVDASTPVGITIVPALNMGVTSFDFSTDQTTNFSKSGSSFSWSSENGVVTIPNPSDEIWTLNQAAPVTTNNGTYTVSAFVHNAANSGYASLGFSTNSSNTSTGGIASPGANSFLGVSFHGGGGNFLNNGTINTDLAHTDLAIGNWYKVVFSATETNSTTFELAFDIYNASSSSVVGSSIFHTTTTVNNSSISVSSGLHPYFSTEGSRLDSLDNFEISLVGV